MTRCAEGHPFDPARHASCPWCGTGVALGGAGDSAVPDLPGKTVALRPAALRPERGPAAAPPPPPPAARNVPPVSPTAPTLPAGSASGSMIVGGDESLPAVLGAQPLVDAAAFPYSDAVSQPTQRLIRKSTGVDPVVGWLVAFSGPMRGQDFTLHAEKNFIGRDPSMDVALAADPAVSRDKHAAVVFEPKKQEFWLIPGDASGLVYRNGELVNGPTVLQDRDSVELGSTQLVLVAFVNQQFRWEAGPSGE